MLNGIKIFGCFRKIFGKKRQNFKNNKTDLLTDTLGDILAHLPVHSLALLAVARGALLADLVLDEK